jgi:hypothetical protein
MIWEVRAASKPPISRRFSVDRVLAHYGGGFQLASVERFRNDGPAVLAQMYRGVAERAV